MSFRSLLSQALPAMPIPEAKPYLRVSWVPHPHHWTLASQPSSPSLPPNSRVQMCTPELWIFHCGCPHNSTTHIGGGYFYHPVIQSRAVKLPAMFTQPARKSCPLCPQSYPEPDHFLPLLWPPRKSDTETHPGRCLSLSSLFPLILVSCFQGFHIK